MERPPDLRKPKEIGTYEDIFSDTNKGKHLTPTYKKLKAASLMLESTDGDARLTSTATPLPHHYSECKYQAFQNVANANSNTTHLRCKAGTFE